MTQTEWLTCQHLSPKLDFLRGRTSDRKFRLFVVGCCRRVWSGLRDARSRAAVEVAERFADGEASEATLWDAHDAAYVAVDDCLEYSVFSEDQAVAAYLAAAPSVDEDFDRHDPFPPDVALRAVGYAIDGLRADCEPEQTALLRDVIGNPFHPVTFDPDWRTPAVVALARMMYDGRDFAHLPILADALEDAGCQDADILAHCRGPGPHARGCWVVDLVLGKE